MDRFFNYIDKYKILLLIFLDLILFIFSLFISNFIRINSFDIVKINYFYFSAISFFIYFILAIYFRIYQIKLRYFNQETIKIISKAYLCFVFFSILIIVSIKLNDFPRSLAIIFPTTFLFLQIFFRYILLNFFLFSKEVALEKEETVFIGFNDYIKNKYTIENSSKFKIVAVVRTQSIKKKIREYLDDVIIISFDEIKKLKQLKNIKNILIGKVNLTVQQKFYLQKLSKRIFYFKSEINYENHDISEINFQPSKFENFLNRVEKKFDTTKWSDYFYNKTIFITGGGGTIGGALVKSIVDSNYKKLVIIDSSEYNLWKISQEIREYLEEKKSSKNTLEKIEFKLLDLNNKYLLEDLFLSFLPQIIYHTASYKHVSLVEYNLKSSIFNNLNSFKLICDMVLKYNTENLTLISSDKAVKPNNVMGHTKRIQEKILLASQLKKTKKQKFSIVRFGNVLGSSGSLLEILERRFNKKLKFHLYNKKLTRFFMTQKECASLIIEISINKDDSDNKIYILDMGKSFSIFDMIRNYLSFNKIKISNQKLLKNYLEIGRLNKFEKIHEKLNYTKLNRTNFNKEILFEYDNNNYKKYLELINKFLDKLYSRKNKEILKFLEKLSF